MTHHRRTKKYSWGWVNRGETARVWENKERSEREREIVLDYNRREKKSTGMRGVGHKRESKVGAEDGGEEEG